MTSNPRRVAPPSTRLGFNLIDAFYVADGRARLFPLEGYGGEGPLVHRVTSELAMSRKLRRRLATAKMVKIEAGVQEANS